MKATVYTKYGPPDVLKLEEIEKPIPSDDEVLVKVQAASVNYSDWSFVRGDPFIVRLYQGLLKPKNRILGADIAGQVEAVGRNVKQFQPGDEIYGDISGCGWGGFAEYAAVPESALALKPANMTFEEAAAVPQAGGVALKGLRDAGGIQAGQKVLIHGASGGIGTFAVQIAKAFGAEVTGVCSTRNVAMVRALGADHVIDYTKEDFSQNGERYDLIMTVAGHRSAFDFGRALSPGGTFVGSEASTSLLIQVMLLGPWITRKGNQKMVSYMHNTKQEDLVTMKEFVEAGKVVPVIDRCYPLSEVAEAVRYYGEGHSRGKVVITVAQNDK